MYLHELWQKRANLCVYLLQSNVIHIDKINIIWQFLWT